MSMRYPGGFITPTAPTVNASTAKGVWTLEEAMQYVKAGNWPVPTGNGDPYFGYNTLLLPGQGTNGAQNNTFLDSSTNNFTITRNGNTTQGTFTPFSHSAGYWGNYFSGGTYLNVTNNTVLNLAGVSFTIEAWIYCTGLSGAYARWIAGKRSLAGPYTISYAFALNSSGQVYLGDYSASAVSAVVIPLNQWVHVAAVSNGTSVQMYVNGVSSGAAANVPISEVNTDLTIGNYPIDNPTFNGYISNLRIIKGQALTTGNFTPPTGPVSSSAVGWTGSNVAGSITGTVSLVTCQSNRFVDNSGNNLTITVSGTPSVQTFQPFGTPTSAYSAATNGGSGYFDGTGDYLTATANNAFNFGTGDFTVEGWIYPTRSGNNAIWGNGPTSAGSFGVAINASNKLQMDYYGGTSLAGATSVQLYAWNYFAFVRSGSNLYIYLNGVRDASTTTSSNNSTNDFVLGRSWTNYTSDEWLGYMSGFRISDATARYTSSTMTVPTSPLTNDASTSVLLNFTNAGVIDNAISNDLETAGGASISTTQYKWGTSSVYFDGTGDYLLTPASQNIAFGTGDFTWEAWIYASTAGDKPIYECRSTNSNTNGFTVTAYSSTVIRVFTNGVVVSATIPNYLNTWTHVAFVRAAGVAKLFINGLQYASAALTSNFTYTIGVVGAGRYSSSSIDTYFTGYIADLRLTKGYARYLYSFTAPTAAFPLFYQAAATPSTDPYFEYNTLLLPGNGTNGAQNNTFLDSSTNAFTITRNGNTTQGTFTPFSKDAGAWGNYFDGTGDYLTVAASANQNFGSSDFTVEFWYYPNGTSRQWFYHASTDYWFGVDYNSTLGLWASSTGASWNLLNADPGGNAISTGIPTLGVWNHIAVGRSGSTWSMWLNGVRVLNVAGVSGSIVSRSAENKVIGAWAGGSQFLVNGYLSNFRVVIGTDLYGVSNTSITVPTSPLTAVSNTQLLTCQSNRFIDNSTNAFAITKNGDTSIQTFSPFSNTAAYSAGTNGGSGYFDGSGDYLALSNVAALQPGASTTPFCIECWINPTATPGTDTAVFGNFKVISYPGNCDGIDLLYLTGRTLAARWGYPNYNDTAQSSALNLNSWNHFAVSRNSSGVMSFYLNGTRWDSKSSNTTVTTATAASFWVGWAGSLSGSTVNPFPGYISGFRFTKGSTPYDPTQSTLTLPTTPPTAITDTSLLCNFTNGGIIDNTMSNDLETVGGASISTTVSKFGGSSMYFDGSGDYLIMPNVLTGQFRTGDFTIEYWDYHGTQSTNYADQVGTLSSASPSGTWRFGTFTNNGGLYFAYHNGSTYVDVTFGSTAYNDSTWRHFAISRYNGVLIAFVNGTQVGAATACTQDFNSSNRVILGSELVTSTYFTGYLQDVRITKGIARYVQNFTPPTSAFPLL